MKSAKRLGPGEKKLIHPVRSGQKGSGSAREKPPGVRYCGKICTSFETRLSARTRKNNFLKGKEESPREWFSLERWSGLVLMLWSIVFSRTQPR